MSKRPLEDGINPVILTLCVKMGVTTNMSKQWFRDHCLNLGFTSFWSLLGVCTCSASDGFVVVDHASDVRNGLLWKRWRWSTKTTLTFWSLRYTPCPWKLRNPKWFLVQCSKRRAFRPRSSKGSATWVACAQLLKANNRYIPLKCQDLYNFVNLFRQLQYNSSKCREEIVSKSPIFAEEWNTKL